MMQAAATATVALKMTHLSQLEPAMSGAAAGIDCSAGASDTTSSVALAGVCLRFLERLDAIRVKSALHWGVGCSRRGRHGESGTRVRSGYKLFISSTIIEGAGDAQQTHRHPKRTGVAVPLHRNENWVTISRSYRSRSSRTVGNSARQSGSSHRVYRTPWQGNPRVNIQNAKGEAKPYQVRQVLQAIQRLEADHG